MLSRRLKFQHGLAHYAQRCCPRQVKLQQSRKRDLSYDEDCFLRHVSSRMWKLKCQDAKICRQREWKLKFQDGLAHYAPRFRPRQVKLQQSHKRDLSCVEDWFWHRSGSPMLFWQGLTVENAVTLHFYDPFIKISLSQTSFTGCNQPPRSVLLPECCRRCCCLCRNCYLVMKLVVFVNRGFVHAMRIVRSFSAMPQYQFFLYCSFRLWKDCCISFDRLNSGFTVEWCSRHFMVCTYSSRNSYLPGINNAK